MDTRSGRVPTWCGRSARRRSISVPRRPGHVRRCRGGVCAHGRQGRDGGRVVCLSAPTAQRDGADNQERGDQTPLGRPPRSRHRLAQGARCAAERTCAGRREPRGDRAQREDSGACRACGARAAVLIGPAGTGKTTLLQTLVNHSAITAAASAPGADRQGASRLQTTTGVGADRCSVLCRRDRYDGETGTTSSRAKTSSKARRTVVVDEAVDDDRGDAGVANRLAEGRRAPHPVGDPRQLPPIGAGRPFVDIVAHLAPENVESMPPPRAGAGYVEHRQATPRRRTCSTSIATTCSSPTGSAERQWPQEKTTSSLARWRTADPRASASSTGAKLRTCDNCCSM